MSIATMRSSSTFDCRGRLCAVVGAVEVAGGAGAAEVAGAGAAGCAGCGQVMSGVRCWVACCARGSYDCDAARRG
ncbi:hypothetical protein PSRA_0521 [Pseudoscardovia radai]|uniref:Uncharacterized protein n=1 Tax=Pseudoscardovia radai TaxID=987066 RepID=A0A261EZP1_9BIFI|nr:hypothetical protein PSRA_0521 [Pseudoscardovia radai]